MYRQANKQGAAYKQTNQLKVVDRQTAQADRQTGCRGRQTNRRMYMQTDKATGRPSPMFAGGKGTPRRTPPWAARAQRHVTCVAVIKHGSLIAPQIALLIFARHFSAT